jgi:hypothetical protein
MALSKLAAGVKIKIIENGETIDTAIVSEVAPGSKSSLAVVKIKSLRLYPETEHRFALFPEAGGWKLLFEGLLGVGEINFSRRAPVYIFELA